MSDVRDYTDEITRLKYELMVAQDEASRLRIACMELRGGSDAVQHELPSERPSTTHKFDVGGHSGYITVGMCSDGRPGEIFIVMAKQGSTINGLMDAFSKAVSNALQYGVPISDLVRKFVHADFEPRGWTSNQEIPLAKSVVSYIFQWLGQKFCPDDLKQALKIEKELT